MSFNVKELDLGDLLDAIEFAVSAVDNDRCDMSEDEIDSYLFADL